MSRINKEYRTRSYNTLSAVFFLSMVRYVVTDF